MEETLLPKSTNTPTSFEQQLTFTQSSRMGSRKFAWSNTRRCLRSKDNMAMGLLPHVPILLPRLRDYPIRPHTQAKGRDFGHQIEAGGLAGRGSLRCLHDLVPHRHLLGWSTRAMEQLAYHCAIVAWCLWTRLDWPMGILPC